MSQIYRSSTAGPPPPDVPDQFTADDATVAVPAANNLNVFGGSSNSDNQEGIRTTASGDTLVVELTNRMQGTGSTSGAVTNDLFTVALGPIPGVFTFEGKVAGFDSANNDGVGYNVFGTVKTNGASASIIGTQDKITNEDIALIDADVNLVVSGNNIILRVTGVTGKNINWDSLFNYSFVG
jgi:hypothetical protein